MKNLCLGTAQLGLDYGITNKTGKINHNETELLLKRAVNENIKYFDTAFSYGDSEEKIGEMLKDEDIEIITKFSTNINRSFNLEDINLLNNLFELSLKRLKRNSINAYLLHNPNDFTKGNSKLLLNWLKSIKEKNLIKRIGVSIYNANDLKNIPLKEIDIIQMPLSIYDQRLLDNSIINKLLDNGIAIHIRSIFLQGLLLQDANKWPEMINQRFRDHHKNYQNIIKSNNLSLLEGTISFIKELKFPELILFGITNIKELNEVIKCWYNKENINNKIDYEKFKWFEPNDLDPRKWKI
tara:strand:- start:3890 stop:4777 length:888 start_codon:yes stop_codon:yes gene_type:complete